jgi:hypothetical protein
MGKKKNSSRSPAPAAPTAAAPATPPAAPAAPETTDTRKHPRSESSEGSEMSLESCAEVEIGPHERAAMNDQSAVLAAELTDTANGYKDLDGPFQKHTGPAYAAAVDAWKARRAAACARDQAESKQKQDAGAAAGGGAAPAGGPPPFRMPRTGDPAPTYESAKATLDARLRVAAAEDAARNDGLQTTYTATKRIVDALLETFSAEQGAAAKAAASYAAAASGYAQRRTLFLTMREVPPIYLFLKARLPNIGVGDVHAIPLATYDLASGKAGGTNMLYAKELDIKFRTPQAAWRHGGLTLRLLMATAQRTYIVHTPRCAIAFFDNVQRPDECPPKSEKDAIAATSVDQVTLPSWRDATLPQEVARCANDEFSQVTTADTFTRYLITVPGEQADMAGSIIAGCDIRQQRERGRVIPRRYYGTQGEGSIATIVTEVRNADEQSILGRIRGLGGVYCPYEMIAQYSDFHEKMWCSTKHGYRGDGLNITMASALAGVHRLEAMNHVRYAAFLGFSFRCYLEKPAMPETHATCQQELINCANGAVHGKVAVTSIYFDSKTRKSKAKTAEEKVAGVNDAPSHEPPPEVAARTMVAEPVAAPMIDISFRDVCVKLGMTVVTNRGSSHRVLYVVARDDAQYNQYVNTTVKNGEYMFTPFSQPLRPQPA